MFRSTVLRPIGRLCYLFNVCVLAIAICFIVAFGYKIYREIDETYFQVTNQDVREIYDNLFKYAGLSKRFKPNFIIINNDAEINGYQNSDKNVIAIYTGVIKFSNDKDELAGFIAHEIGHYILYHSKLNPDNNDNLQTILEGSADKIGIYLVLRAGYDVCKVNDLWYAIREHRGDFGYNSNHPNYSYRYWQLSFPMCGE